MGDLGNGHMVFEMKRAASPSFLGLQFDEFLSAPVCEEKNGMLSVLSALARLGMDPWQEAAKLAELSREAATQRLVSTIAKLPEVVAAHVAPKAVAARLVALLPRDATASSAQPAAAQIRGVSAKAAANVNSWLIIVAVFIALVLGAQWIGATLLSPAPSENTSTTATPSQTPPPVKGH